MTLRFEWEWQSAPEVRLPELRATWSTLTIDVGDTTATMVEERHSRSGLRRNINVPLYPLAEWVAYNWWKILAPTPDDSDAFSLKGAGDGFPWPDLALASGPGYVLATLRRADRDAEFIRFLSETEALLAPDSTEYELRRLVENTVQQLEQVGIAGTPLQSEWKAIASADAEVADFCRTSAALGLDPYDLSDEETTLVLGLADGIDDSSLVTEMAASVRRPDAQAAHDWLKAALASVELARDVPEFAIPFMPLPTGSRERPWEVGYDRARILRGELAPSPVETVHVEALVGVADVPLESPLGIVGLASALDHGTVVAVGSHTPPPVRRFAAARAIGRRTFDSHVGGSLLTLRNEYAAKVERAFAAEFLAPAAGLEVHLDGNFSDDSITAAARAYGVSRRVVMHQVENQIRPGVSF